MNYIVKASNGLYFFVRPECTASISDATKLIHFLTTDITSEAPQVRWTFHPERSNLNIFVGSGLNDNQSRVVIMKRTIKDGLDVTLEYYDGSILQYSLSDLCFVPEASTLLRLYAQVAPRVIESALTHRTGGKMLRTIPL